MRVLVVDDDEGMRETIRLILRVNDIRVDAVESGTHAITAARAESYDLVIIDQRLPDITGLDVARTFRRERLSVPWILVSAWMDVDLAVDAMRLGALRAVSVPFDVETVILAALAEASTITGGWPSLPLTPRLRAAKSTVERFAHVVLRACDAIQDLRTIHNWALAVGMSRSGLAETCRIVDVQPHDARDFMRVLRVLARSRGAPKQVKLELDVADHRTLLKLLRRAGIGDELSALTLQEFLSAQRFIERDHLALATITGVVANLNPTHLRT
jgi:CheY-like chemotaxis protein